MLVNVLTVIEEKLIFEVDEYLELTNPTNQSEEGINKAEGSAADLGKNVKENNTAHCFIMIVKLPKSTLNWYAHNSTKCSKAKVKEKKHWKTWRYHSRSFIMFSQ